MTRSAPMALDWNGNVIALLVIGSTRWLALVVNSITGYKLRRTAVEPDKRVLKMTTQRISERMKWLCLDNLRLVMPLGRTVKRSAVKRARNVRGKTSLQSLGHGRGNNDTDLVTNPRQLPT
jgi:hypothetical protein